jgi:hypothetical protein
MRVPPERRAELHAEALKRIARSGENDFRRFLLAECLEAYADLDEAQRQRLQALLTTEQYQHVRPLMITTYERLLTHDPACGFPVRLEQAACGLRVSPHELTPEARAADPCLQQFANLLQHYEGELFMSLEKMKWLGPEDLYYLGFHYPLPRRKVC